MAAQAQSNGKSSPRKLQANLVLRSYRPDDHVACELLEVRANQFKNAKARKIPVIGPVVVRLQDLIQVHTQHPAGFDAMAKNAEECEIVVCEDKSIDPPAIIAVVVVNIRTVFWSGAAIKVGWVYGLRVDEAHQRRGIGMALSDELERRCRERGVSMLFLTVNLDNTKAIALYNNLGYKHASHRAPATKYLSKEETVPKDLLVVRIEPEVAAALTAKSYEKMDMSPAPSTREGFSQVLASSNCEGTFVAVERSELSPKLERIASGDEKELSNAVVEAIRSGEITSYAGVSLWNGSTFKTFKVVRIIFLKETWLSLPFQVALLCVVTACMGYWWWKLLGRMIAAASSCGLIGGSTSEQIQAHSAWGMWFSVGFLIVELAAIAVMSKFAHKFVMFLKFIVSRDSSHLMARAFAPFSNGPTGTDCLRAALVASQNYSRSRGFGLWIMNVAADHPYSSAFPKAGFRTQFLQKWLVDPPSTVGGNEGSGEWREFTSAAFCDPRDL